MHPHNVAAMTEKVLRNPSNTLSFTSESDDLITGFQGKIDEIELIVWVQVQGSAKPRMET